MQAAKFIEHWYGSDCTNRAYLAKEGIGVLGIWIWRCAFANDLGYKDFDVFLGAIP